MYKIINTSKSISTRGSHEKMDHARFIFSKKSRLRVTINKHKDI